MQHELFPVAEYTDPAYGMTARSTRSKATNRKAIAFIHECDRPIKPQP